jgi:hypothetical protein
VISPRHWDFGGEVLEAVSAPAAAAAALSVKLDGLTKVVNQKKFDSG